MLGFVEVRWKGNYAKCQPPNIGALFSCHSKAAGFVLLCDSVCSAAITTQRWVVYVEAAWINRLCCCRQSDRIRLWIKDPHIVVIIIYVWGNFRDDARKLKKKVKLCLLINWVWTGLAPGRGQPRAEAAGIQMSSPVALWRLTFYLWSLAAGRQATKGFFSGG